MSGAPCISDCESERYWLRWSDVEIKKGILTILAQKTGQLRIVPLNPHRMKERRASPVAATCYRHRLKQRFR
jgi:integrase